MSGATTARSGAAVRRAWARHPDASAARRQLGAELASDYAEEAARLTGYLLDPRAAALVADDDASEAWLAGPLFRRVGPDNFAPHEDALAAAIAAGSCVEGEQLSRRLVAARFAPRADDLVALAVAALPAGARAAAVEMLFADRGPDPELLALSVVQCGRCLAWSPELLAQPIGERVVSALIALLVPERPRPLVLEVARALGPIAAQPGPLASRVREAALAAIAAASPRAPVAGSFSAELASIGRARSIPDEDRWKALPRRELAAACAYVLGFAAPRDPAAFGEARARVLDDDDSGELLAPFLDGLIAAVHDGALTEVVRAMLAGDADDGVAALGLAATVPLDGLLRRLLDELESPVDARRIAACAAVELLEGDGPDYALALRLGDSSPDVAAAAARSLIARGRADLVHAQLEIEDHPLRLAIAAAATGSLEVPVISELVQAALEAAADGEATPIGGLVVDALFGSAAGLEVAAGLVGEVPDAVSMLALASLVESHDVGVLAPSGARAAFAASVVRVAAGDAYAGDELGSLALYLLARVSAGDDTAADAIADAFVGGPETDGNLLAAIGELRCATDKTSAVIAGRLADDVELPSRVAAAAVAGRALVPGHPAWAQVRGLLELGTIAGAAAWSALRDRARRNV